MREIKFRAWNKTTERMLYFPNMEFGISADAYHLALMCEDTASHGTLEWVWEQKVEIMEFTGQKDRYGKEIYENDIVRYTWGGVLSYGIVKKEDTGYVDGAGFEIDCWCGRSPYGYECECITWNCLHVIGNIFEDNDLLEKVKYGVTAGDKPRTREGIKSMIMTALKKYPNHYNGWIPSQTEIQYCGIPNTELANELRDELVKEGKLDQDPERYWMVKVL